MAAKLCLLVFAIFGSFQVPITGAPLSVSNESLTRLAADLEKLSEGLSERLDALSTRMNSAMEASDSELSSNIAYLEEAWARRIDHSAARHEACSPQINRLYDLSTEVLSSTRQCASDYRQKLMDVLQSSKVQSSSLQYAANKLSQIVVDCVEANGHLPLCVVSTDPMSALASLLQEAGETLGMGSARAEAYGAQILSCWRQSSTNAAPLAQEIIRDIAQCARAQS